MRAQRVAAATAAVAIVSVCCAVGISAGSASTSGSIDPSVKAIPDPDVSQTTIVGKKRRSTAKTGEAEAGHAKVSKIADVESAKLRTREVFNVGEDPSSLSLRVGTFNVRTSALTTAAAGCRMPRT